MLIMLMQLIKDSILCIKKVQLEIKEQAKESFIMCFSKHTNFFSNSSKSTHSNFIDLGRYSFKPANCTISNEKNININLI